MDRQNRPEKLPDHQALSVINEFYEALEKGSGLQHDLAANIASVIEATIVPRVSARELAAALIEDWSNRYQFDAYSDRTGDRTSTVVDDDGSAHDPDGSGRRNANAKKTALISELMAYVTCSADSGLDHDTRRKVLFGAVQRMCYFNGISQDNARFILGRSVFNHIDWHTKLRDSQNLDPVVRNARLTHVISSMSLKVYQNNPTWPKEPSKADFAKPPQLEEDSE